jgi:hypothetical protein
MCIHASWMPVESCTRCTPLPKPFKPQPLEKRTPVAPGYAHPTEDIDPLSVPSFSEDDPRGMNTCDGIIVHRRGPGQAVAAVRDTHGRKLTCTVPRALWALAASQGLVEHATTDEDVVHDFEGCPAEVTNEVGCRYSCTDWRHFKKVAR